jgi:uncharacterized membrane protein YhiD involved in acid resistance
MTRHIGFLGAGVIFKDSGSVRGLNTAATIWCSAAIGAISGLGNPLHALILTAAVLTTNIVLRPLAYRLYPAQASGPEQEVTYGFELICRPEDEAHMRALLLQGDVEKFAYSDGAAKRGYRRHTEDESHLADQGTWPAGRGT